MLLPRVTSASKLSLSEPHSRPSPPTSTPSFLPSFFRLELLLFINNLLTSSLTTQHGESLLLELFCSRRRSFKQLTCCPSGAPNSSSTLKSISNHSRLQCSICSRRPRQPPSQSRPHAFHRIIRCQPACKARLNTSARVSSRQLASNTRCVENGGLEASIWTRRANP